MSMGTSHVSFLSRLQFLANWGVDSRAAGTVKMTSTRSGSAVEMSGVRKIDSGSED